MEFNIFLVSIDGILEVEDRLNPGSCTRSFKTSPIQWWDITRYLGDLQFVKGVQFTYRPDGDDERSVRKYCRPSSIDEAIKWVEQNVPELNRPRLIRALTDMQDNSRLYFRIDV